MSLKRLLSTITLTLSLTISSSVWASEFQPLKGQTAVRVCADAYNLPYSNDKLEGFDNKIADIIGEELGIPVEYYWFPQRIGFSRNTIKKVDPETGKFLCDLAMSIPAEKGLYSPTTAYFSSIESMVYRKDEGYDLSQISDIAAVNANIKKLRIGLFDRAIATEALLANGLENQIDYFHMMPGDAKINGGRIIAEELASGRIDVAFAWGPIAGFYANQSEVDMVVVPLNELGSDYIFSFGMGVRPQDTEWRDLLNEILIKRKDDISAILAQYNMPSIAQVEVTIKKKRTAYTIENGKVDERTYSGWKVYDSTCFVCHGTDGMGTERGPNLLTSLDGMSARSFRKTVLKRYFAKVNLDDPTRRAAYLEQQAPEQADQFKMPLWSDNASIRPHIAELYAYLKARSDSALAAGEPQR